MDLRNRYGHRSGYIPKRDMGIRQTFAGTVAGTGVSGPPFGIEPEHPRSIRAPAHSMVVWVMSSIWVLVTAEPQLVLYRTPAQL